MPTAVVPLPGRGHAREAVGTPSRTGFFPRRVFPELADSLAAATLELPGTTRIPHNAVGKPTADRWLDPVPAGMFLAATA